ncbi:MAG: DNA ligase, partial [Candidatus Heimdallarchaeota archaeon]|nr:DNA ligase [Candidatus Heimdallarchaeota archaeon]
MKLTTLTDFYQKLDATTKRLEMIDILMDLFEITPQKEMRAVVYLTSGKICADYIGLELGFADKMVIKAIAKSIGKAENEVSNLFKKKGDLGEVAEQLIGQTGQQQLGAFFTTSEKEGDLTVSDVWDILNKIALIEGKGANQKKTNLLLGLYSKATPIEAKYIT